MFFVRALCLHTSKYYVADQDDPEMCDYALDGLKQMMAVKSRVVLPYLVPQVSCTPLPASVPVSYTHLRAHETKANLVCRLLLEKSGVVYILSLIHI